LAHIVPTSSGVGRSQLARLCRASTRGW